MEWVFGALTLGCIIFFIKILSDYSSRAKQWHARVRQCQAEQRQSESQFGEYTKGKEAALARTIDLEEQVKTLEQMRNDLKTKIEDLKRDHAKKGKVILHRQSDQKQE